MATTGEVLPGTIKAVEVEGERIALCNVDGELHAVQDECTHEYFPLSEGQLDGDVLTCSLHGARFDVETGEVLGLPADEPVKIYQVRVEGEDILVAVD